ncbi:unnamed protein product, partial [Didymodactylos carnosus]
MMTTPAIIGNIFKTFKHQTKFLHERDRLFSASVLSSLTSTPPLSPLRPTTTQSPLPDYLDIDAQHIQDILDTTDQSNLTTAVLTTSDVTDIVKQKRSIPDDYSIPTLPSSLQEAIRNGDMKKFDNHCNHRSIQTKNDYTNVTRGILNHLKIPITNDNMNSWKNSIQSKMKQQRRPLATTNSEIMEAKKKYAHEKSGRPIKVNEEKYAERRIDRLAIIQSDMNSEDIQKSIESITNELKKDEPDWESVLIAWETTLKERRIFVVRNKIGDVLELYSGYKHKELIYHEVKLICGLDVLEKTRACIDLVYNKMSSNEKKLFVTDPLPFRVIKLLCKRLNESWKHILIR